MDSEPSRCVGLSVFMLVEDGQWPAGVWWRLDPAMAYAREHGSGEFGTVMPGVWSDSTGLWTIQCTEVRNGTAV